MTSYSWAVVTFYLYPSTPFWDRSTWNISDLQFDLSKSFKVKTILITGLSTFVFLLIFNSNIWPNCIGSFPRHRDMECMWPWFYSNEFEFIDFKVTFQIWLCIWTPHVWLPISVQQQYVPCGNCCFQVIMAWKMRNLENTCLHWETYLLKSIYMYSKVYYTPMLQLQWLM